jgi:hypothetical protein
LSAAPGARLPFPVLRQREVFDDLLAKLLQSQRIDIDRVTGTIDDDDDLFHHLFFLLGRFGSFSRFLLRERQACERQPG